MNELRVVPAEVLDVQTTASDPLVSAWVAANAGSGKTHVLAQRVIRLLLDGCEPRRILCLTFTKAAAANMAKRVFDTLAKWTSLDDVALDARVARHRREAHRRSLRAHARRLFAAALETPGGLKVQTIHAFCTRLLHQFPFEANVAARFTVLEERAEAELIDKLRLEVLLQAAAEPDGAARPRARDRDHGGGRSDLRRPGARDDRPARRGDGVDRPCRRRAGGDRRLLARRSASTPTTA